MLQGIFPTQGSNPVLLHCRQMLFPLSQSKLFVLLMSLVILHWKIVVTPQQVSVTLTTSVDFPGGSDGKASVYKAGDLGSIPGLGRIPGKGIVDGYQPTGTFRIYWGYALLDSPQPMTKHFQGRGLVIYLPWKSSTKPSLLPSTPQSWLRKNQTCIVVRGPYPLSCFFL